MSQTDLRKEIERPAVEPLLPIEKKLILASLRQPVIWHPERSVS